MEETLKLTRVSATGITAYALAGAVLITGAVFLYLHRLVTTLERDAQVVGEIYAQFCRAAASPEGETEAIGVIFESVIQRIDFPVVITDREDVPRQWINVDVAPDANDEASLERLGRLVDRMDARVEPIDIRVGRSGPLLSRVHYGASDRIQELRGVPWLLGSIVLLYGALGLWIVRMVRAQEQKALWVGMARETAHQLGTPLSGLAGWIELLEGETLPAERIAREMSVDLGRLEGVAARFGRIGSRVQLEQVDLLALAETSVERLRGRSGRVGLQVSSAGPAGRVSGDPELLAWVIENLVRNAVEASRGAERPGRVWVEIGPLPEGAWSWRGAGKGWVRLVVNDNGRGMTRNEMRRAFRPGHTTKETGWGLGLALARRIVEDDHRGRIAITRSRPGEGTAVEVWLPGVGEEGGVA